MSTATLPEAATAIDADYAAYRSISSGAIFGLVLGCLSVLAPLAGSQSLEACFFMCVIPVAGLIVSLRALSAINRLPNELTGKKLAIAGAALSGMFLVGGIAYGSFVYATEVPDGYDRVSFSQLEPGRIDLERGVPVPAEVVALDGEKIFIKGYMRPPEYRTNISEFLLVRDNNQCCFGDLAKVKYHDQIQVRLEKPLKADYSMGIFRVAGVLHVKPENAMTQSGPPVYSMTVDYLK